jgi:hypothetical protein
MDKAEALAVLEQQLERYRKLPFAELLRLMDESEALEVVVPGGTTYQIKIDAVWDDEARVHLRLIGAIDDGGWRAFSPLTSDFIIAPDGSFIGE